MINLDLNESPFDLVAEVKEEIATRIKGVSFNRYPRREIIEESIASLYGVSVDRVLVGNGSDELIQLIAMVYGRTGKCVIPTPTFSMYEKCIDSVGGSVCKVPLRPDFSLDVPALVEECKDAKLVFLCNPNNPTGQSVSVSELKVIAHSTAGVLVIDEAYADFQSENALSLLDDQKNIVILRTFSKAWRLAGIRLGIGIADPALVQEIDKARLPYNLNSLTIATLQVVLEIMGTKAPQVEKLVRERDRVYSELLTMRGVKTYPSTTNFILFSTEQNASLIWENLKDQGIQVRKFDDSVLENCLRVSIGLPKENNLFLEIMGGLL